MTCSPSEHEWRDRPIELLVLDKGTNKKVLRHIRLCLNCGKKETRIWDHNPELDEVIRFGAEGADTVQE